jgi:hypothetical protein
MLRATRRRWKGSPDVQIALDELSLQWATWMAERFTRFDQARFLRDCGFIHETQHQQHHDNAHKDNDG